MMALVFTSALFGVGMYGLLTRRDLVGVLASVEVVIGAALMLLVSLGAMRAGTGDGTISAIALLALVLAASEAAVGLALLVMVARRTGTTRIDELREVKG